MVFPLHTLILAEEDAQKQAELASAVAIAERYSDRNFLWRFFREEVEHIKRSTFAGEWISGKMLASHFWLIVAGTVFLLLVAGILACELPGLGGGTKPTVVILSPVSGTQAKVGEIVAIQSSATDVKGVTRVELWVDGSLVRSDVSPQQQPAFSVIQEWTAAVLGSHSVTVKAYNTAGRVSDPATITVNVFEEGTAAVPTTPAGVALPPGAPWAAITAKVLNVRRGPGTNYPVIGQLQQNDVVEISGKNADSSWLQIVYPTGTIGRGWISASYAQVRGSPASIPVVEPPPPPTPTPASSP